VTKGIPALRAAERTTASRAASPAIESARPWAYNGSVFCLSEDGKTYVVAAGETFSVRRVNALDEMAMATPAMAGGRLLVRTDSRLYSMRQTKGR